MNENTSLIDINENPFNLFDKWFEEAKLKEINDPNAMSLATVGSNSSPSLRVVLLKSYSATGFVFYTNLKSQKGISIKYNPHVALNFHWKSLLRQVRIEGVAKLIENAEAEAYFNTRPKLSRIGAWASSQSSELTSREKLEDKVNEYKKKFKEKKIPRPSHWSGFRVEPNLIEFWQDKPFRLHDRIKFVKLKNDWIGKRLYP
jgi:pyridoxamine 5'-phosphate oxidase